MVDDSTIRDAPPEAAEPRSRWGWRHLPAAICVTLGVAIGVLAALALGLHLVALVKVPGHRPYATLASCSIMILGSIALVVAGRLFSRRRFGAAMAWFAVGWSLAGLANYVGNLERD